MQHHSVYVRYMLAYHVISSQLWEHTALSPTACAYDVSLGRSATSDVVASPAKPAHLVLPILLCPPLAMSQNRAHVR